MPREMAGPDLVFPVECDFAEVEVLGIVIAVGSETNPQCTPCLRWEKPFECLGLARAIANRE
jgi:hypothetical protein